MNADESINTDELRTQIDRLIDGGVHGIFPFGTNGEGYILNEKEKCEVLEAAIDQVKEEYLYMLDQVAFNTGYYQDEQGGRKARS